MSFLVVKQRRDFRKAIRYLMVTGTKDQDLIYLFWGFSSTHNRSGFHFSMSRLREGIDFLF